MEDSFQLPNSNFGPMLGVVPGHQSLGSISDLSLPFDLEGDESGRKVVRCQMVCGTGTVLSCDDTSVEIPKSGTSYIWAKIDHAVASTSTEPHKLSVGSGSDKPINTVRYSYRILYVMKDGDIYSDVRLSPVFVMAF